MEKSKKIKIQDYLLGLGIKPGIKGFDYLVQAVNIYQPRMGITKELYPAIAKNNGDTSIRVEKAIRHAISLSEKAESNSDFIARCKLMIDRIED